jgi:hypothetical protein
MDSHIVEVEIVMEGKRPEPDRKVGAAKHGMKSIANGLMGTFARAILVRRVGSSRFKAIAGILKEINHLTTATKITTKVKVDILVREINRETVECKPAIQKIDGGSLGTKRLTIESAAVMIRYQTVASLTIETLKTLNTSRILGTLNHETEVNRDTLIASGGMARISQSTGGLAELSLNTDGTGVQGRSNGEGRNANSMFMQVRHATRMNMGKTMVPEDVGLITGEIRNNKIIRRGSKEQGFKIRGGGRSGSRAARRISSGGREIHKGNIQLTAKAMEAQHLFSNRRARGRRSRWTGGTRRA